MKLIINIQKSPAQEVHPHRCTDAPVYGDIYKLWLQEYIQ